MQWVDEGEGSCGVTKSHAGLISLATIAATRQDWFEVQAVPHKLLMALMLDTYRGHFYLAGPPVWLQKVVFAALAPIARLKGYRIPLVPATRRQKVRHVASPDFGVGELRSSG